MAGIIVSTPHSSTRIVAPEEHETDCEVGEFDGLTSMVSIGTYCLMSSGAAILHEAFALELLEYLHELHGGADVDFDSDIELIESEIAEFMNEAGGLSPVVCDCAGEVVLATGASVCVWDTGTDLLGHFADVGETSAAGELVVGWVNDVDQVTERTIFGIDSNIYSPLVLAKLPEMVDRDAAANELAKNIVSWSGLTKTALAYRQDALPTTESRRLGAVVSSLYAAHQLRGILHGDRGRLSTSVSVARFPENAEDLPIASRVAFPARASARVVQQVIESTFERTFADHDGWDLTNDDFAGILGSGPSVGQER